MCLLRVPWYQPEVTSDIFGHLLHFTQLNKGERRLVMDIDRTIERMDKENRDTVKKLSALYKETQKNFGGMQNTAPPASEQRRI